MFYASTSLNAPLHVITLYIDYLRRKIDENNSRNKIKKNLNERDVIFCSFQAFRFIQKNIQIFNVLPPSRLPFHSPTACQLHTTPSTSKTHQASSSFPKFKRERLIISAAERYLTPGLPNWIFDSTNLSHAILGLSQFLLGK